jgi:ABC-type uncharacterized transport system substrate-binding protein
VVFVSTTPGSLAAKAATATIPIVFVAVADPVGAGLVPNLARSGGNVTGITHIVAELTGKRLELLKEIVPSASRIAVLVNPDDPNATVQIQNAEAAARTLGVQLQPVLPLRSAGDLERAFEVLKSALPRCSRVAFLANPTNNASVVVRKAIATAAQEMKLQVLSLDAQDLQEIERALAEAKQSEADAAVFAIDGFFVQVHSQIAEFALRHKLPTMFTQREHVVAGGMMSFRRQQHG